MERMSITAGASSENTPDVSPCVEREALELPRWIKPDLSRGMRGALLYLEEWGGKRRFEDRGNVFTGIALIPLGITVMFMGIAIGNPSAVIMLGVLGFVVAFMGTALFLQTVKTMPLALYEKGFTLVKVPWLEGWRRQEYFVPWERLEGVELEESALSGISFRHMKMIYDAGKEQVLDYNNVKDPFEVMKILWMLVPGKMNAAFKVYLGEEDERRMIGDPFPGRVSDPEWAMTLLLVVFMSFMMGPIVGDFLSGGKLLRALPIFLIFLPVATFFFHMSVKMLDRRAQRNLIRKKAAFTPGGISVPRTFYGRTIKHIRDPVPWNEIKAVRMKLQPTFYFHEAEFETSAGERYRIPYDIYGRMGRLPSFRKKGWDYFNTAPAASSLPVERWNHAGLAVFVMLLAAPALLVGATGAGAGFMGGWGDVLQKTCLFMILVVLLPLVVLGRLKMAQRARLGEGLFASDKGISIPNAPAKFHRVEPWEYIDARIDKDIYGFYCELDTTKGNIRLPRASAGALIRAGYRVENSDDIDILPADGFLGETSRLTDVAGDFEVPATIEPGELLLEGKSDELEMMNRLNLAFGVVLTAAGVMVVLVALPPLSRILLAETCCRTILLFFGILMLGPGICSLGRRNRSGSLRFYENGVSYPLPPAHDDEELFVPYGRIRNIVGRPTGKGSTILHVGYKADIVVPNSLPGFRELFPEIEKRAGNPRYDCRSFEFPYHGMVGFYQMFLCFLAFALGLGAAMLYVEVRESMGLEVSILEVLFYGAPLSLVLVVMFTTALEFTGKIVRKTGRKGRIDVRMLGAALVVGLLLFAAGLTVDPFHIVPMKLEQDSPPADFAYSDGIVENLTLELVNSIYVKPGSHLAIRNSSISFDLKENKGCSIYVAKGGRLDIINSTVRSIGDNHGNGSRAGNDRYGYGFEIYGEARFSDSYFTGIYGSRENLNYDGGMEIYSDEVTIVNCTISGNPTNGILIYRVAPRLEGCVIERNLDDGIEMYDSGAYILNCTISDNEWGVVMAGCDCRIVGCDIRDNGYGITIVDSSPTIRDNHFENNTRYGMKSYYGTAVDHGGNTFHNNGEDYLEGARPDFYYLRLCSFSFAATASAAGGILILAVRRRKRNREVYRGGDERSNAENYK